MKPLENDACKFKLCEWNRKVECGKGGNFKEASLITLKGLLLGDMCVSVCCVYTYIIYVYRNMLTYTYIDTVLAHIYSSLLIYKLLKTLYS